MCITAPDGVPPISSIITRDAYTIFVSWGKVPTDNRNGIILGYVVFYKPNGQNVPYVNKTIDDESKLSTEITGLKPFTQVCVKMAAFTKVGVSTNWDSKACELITTDQTGSAYTTDNNLNNQARMSATSICLRASMT